MSGIPIQVATSAIIADMAAVAVGQEQQQPIQSPQTPEVEQMMTFNDWDISLHLLRELYLKPELSAPPAPSRPGFPRSGSSNIVGTWSGSSPIGSHTPTLPLGVIHGSAAPTPQTPPSIMRPRTRADSSASVVSQGQSVAGSEMGNGAAGLRRSPSMSHAATPRHATASRRRTATANNKSGSNADIFLPPSGSNGSSPRNAAVGPSAGLAVGNSSLRQSGSLASLSSVATGSVANDRSRVISYSAQSTSNYLPTRVLSFEQKKRVLVTGGAGFLGSHLVDRLMLMGHEVMVVDNFFTGMKSSISQWINHPNFELVRHDVVNPLLVEVDQIYHLACPASPKSYQVNQIKTIKTNFMGTMNMLGLAKRTKARFLLASTSEVYGDPDVHPQPESYNGNVSCSGPRGCYDEGKRIAETLTYGYLYQDGVDVRVARIFNTYGPRMHPYDGRVVSNFILQGLKGEPLTVYGDGSQTRSFMFVHDLTDALIALMNVEPNEVAERQQQLDHADEDDIKEERDDLLRGVHGPVNIGNPHEFTIKELVEEVARAVEQVKGEMAAAGHAHFATAQQSIAEQQAAPEEALGEEASGGGAQDGIRIDRVGGLDIVYCPMPIDDPRQRRPVTKRAKRLLNWEPRWSLREGLVEMCRFYAQRMELGEINVS